MIQIFNKTKENNINENIIDKIHNEFNTAGEILFQEALKIIKNTKIVSPNKVNLLKNFGFNQAKEVVEINEKLEVIQVNKELANVISEYKIKYPDLKFITEEQIKIICEKYNLIFGDVSKFTGFVPEKNLKEIEKYMIKYKFSDFWITLESNKVLDMSEMEIRGEGEYEHFFNKEGKYFFQRKKDLLEGKLFYGKAIINGELIELTGKDGYLTPTQLKICAPIKDFDTKGMEVTNYKLEKYIPDPVVLQPVNKGYLILTAWGDEASDPIVINEQNQ